ncbi:MAG: hypothetical protein AAGI50_16070 [Pseudomonadota bacterium]
MTAWLGRSALLMACLALVACDNPVSNRVARDTAKANVTPVFVEQFPFAPVEPGVNCIIDSATSGELIRLAASPVTGPATDTATLVVEIAARPKTIRCFTRAGIALI